MWCGAVWYGVVWSVLYTCHAPIMLETMVVHPVNDSESLNFKNVRTHLLSRGRCDNLGSFTTREVDYRERLPAETRTSLKVRQRIKHVSLMRLPSRGWVRSIGLRTSRVAGHLFDS